MLVGAAVVAGVLISRSVNQRRSVAERLLPDTVQPACVGDAHCKSVCDPERKRKRQRFGEQHSYLEPGAKTAVIGRDSAE